MTKIVWEKPDFGFSTPPSIPAGFLGLGEIHVWKAGLDRLEFRLNEFLGLLSAPEKERAGRFRFVEHRQRFIAAHAILRQILGAYCSQAPAEVEIQTDEFGKPGLKPDSEPSENHLLFNLSHSDVLLLLSLGRGLISGVDLERIRSNYDEKVVSQHFFSQAEQDWLDRIPESRRKLAFFHLWTCKEAVLKADGGGIRRALGQVAIEFGPNLETAQCQLLDQKNKNTSWSLRLFSPQPEYTAALAFEKKASAAPDPKLKFYEWGID